MPNSIIQSFFFIPEINKLTPSTTGDVVIIKEQTTSSSSDSIFTDPLTPIGFATEINRCYISEENVFSPDDSNNYVDCEQLNELTKSTLAARNYVRKSIQTSTSGLNYFEKLNKLSVSKIENFNVNIDVDTNNTLIDDSDMMTSLNSLLSKISASSSAHFTTSGSINSEERDISVVDNTNTLGIFNVARVKKVELQDLLVKVPAAADTISSSGDGKFIFRIITKCKNFQFRCFRALVTLNNLFNFS